MNRIIKRNMRSCIHSFCGQVAMTLGSISTGWRDKKKKRGIGVG